MEQLTETASQPLSQLVGRLFGEGDQQDFLEGHPGFQDQFQHQLDDGESLARTGRRLHNDLAIGVDVQQGLGGLGAKQIRLFHNPDSGHSACSSLFLQLGHFKFLGPQGKD